MATNQITYFENILIMAQDKLKSKSRKNKNPMKQRFRRYPDVQNVLADFDVDLVTQELLGEIGYLDKFVATKIRMMEALLRNTPRGKASSTSFYVGNNASGYLGVEYRKSVSSMVKGLYYTDRAPPEVTIVLTGAKHDLWVLHFLALLIEAALDIDVPPLPVTLYAIGDGNLDNVLQFKVAHDVNKTRTSVPEFCVNGPGVYDLVVYPKIYHMPLYTTTGISGSVAAYSSSAVRVQSNILGEEVYIDVVEMAQRIKGLPDEVRSIYSSWIEQKQNTLDVEGGGVPSILTDIARKAQLLSRLTHTQWDALTKFSGVIDRTTVEENLSNLQDIMITLDEANTNLENTLGLIDDSPDGIALRYL